MPHPRKLRPVLNRYATPDMRWSRRAPVAAPQEVAHQRRTLRQDLKGVPVRLLHRVKDAPDELLRHVFVEEIAHRIDEDHARTAPAQRLIKALRSQCQIE